MCMLLVVYSCLGMVWVLNPHFFFSSVFTESLSLLLSSPSTKMGYYPSFSICSSTTLVHLPIYCGVPPALSSCHYVPKIQLSLKLNAKGKLEALHTVCLCVPYATSEGPLRILVYFVMTIIWFIHYFLTAVFTDSPSPSPSVWGPHLPPQLFAPWQMFPAPFPVGYNPCRMEQHPGVYVC